MAWFLAGRLRDAGFTCMGVYGRDADKAGVLAERAGGPVIDNPGDLDDEAECTIVAVSDHAIAEVANKLSLTNSVVLHTAGAVPLDVIDKEEKAVLWFIYSILKTELPDHKAIPVMWEASSPKASKVVKTIGGAVSDIVMEGDAGKRQWLHLSAVFANNFTNHLVTICEKICQEQGLSFKLMMPILQQTLYRINYKSPAELQTGPAIRRDGTTIDKHVQLLAQHPQWQQVYQTLTSSIEDMYNYDPEGKA
jgi:predicted short-subunit dehydrogenase-like oxidoreductase (DUF2520 family)